jgi:hypothetical protein
VCGVATDAVLTQPSPAVAVENPPPGLGIRLVDVPVASAQDPRARTYIVDHVSPGAVIKRRVEVSNGTQQTARISMYPEAAEIIDGTFRASDAKPRDELSSWISVAPREPVLDPQERAMVTVSIRVPADASSGERYGVVWAERRDVSAQNGLTQVSRVGVRIYLSVGPGGEPASDFKIASMSASRSPDGTPHLRATVDNVGQRALDLSARLRLSQGPGGLSAGPFTSDHVTTVPAGQTATVSLGLNEALPPGPWLARLTVTSGREERDAQATVTFPIHAGQGDPVRARSGVSGWIWLLAGGLLVVLVGLPAAALRASRRTHLRQGTLEV